MIETVDILGVKVAATDLRSASMQVAAWVKEKQKTYVCFAPVSTIVDSQENPQYHKIINASGMTAPDGVPLVWLARMKGHKSVQRTCGPDFMEEFCRISQPSRFRHFFFGGTDDVTTRLLTNLKSKYPDLQIAGYITPGLRTAGQMEDRQVIEQINSSRADVLWIGLGSPKQDVWMANHRALLNVPVLLGVGAAFDFLSGQKKRAPDWMKHCGLEWFYRVCSEPGRLWKRYLFGNTKFIYYLIKKEIFKHG